MASLDWAKTIARRNDKHLSLWIWCAYIRDFTVVLFCFVYITVSTWRIHVNYLLISFWVTSLTMGRSYDCTRAGEITLKDMGKIDWFQSTTNTKRRTMQWL